MRPFVLKKPCHISRFRYRSRNKVRWRRPAGVLVNPTKPGQVRSCCGCGIPPGGVAKENTRVEQTAEACPDFNHWIISPSLNHRLMRGRNCCTLAGPIPKIYLSAGAASDGVCEHVGPLPDYQTTLGTLPTLSMPMLVNITRGLTS